MKIAVIGGGVAAFEAAVAARKNAPECEITVLSREAVPPYRRPALSGMVAQDLDDARFYIKNMDFYARERIGVELDMTAVKLDLAAKRVEFADGEKIDYDRLVIATGARPFVPPVPGLTGDKVAVLREYSDLENLRARLEGNCRKAVVLGGGVLGLELAASLLERGLEVTVVEAAPAIMPRNLDADAGRAVMEYLQKLPKLALRFGVLGQPSERTLISACMSLSPVMAGSFPQNGRGPLA